MSNFYVAIYFPDNYNLHTWCYIIKINATALTAAIIISRAKIGNKNRKQNVVLRSLTKFGIRADINKLVSEEVWVVRDVMSAL